MTTAIASFTLIWAAFGVLGWWLRGNQADGCRGNEYGVQTVRERGWYLVFSMIFGVLLFSVACTEIWKEDR